MFIHVCVCVHLLSGFRSTLFHAFTDFSFPIAGGEEVRGRLWSDQLRHLWRQGPRHVQLPAEGQAVYSYVSLGDRLEHKNTTL